MLFRSTPTVTPAGLPPRLVQFQPANTILTSRLQPITLTFSQSMDQASVAAATYRARMLSQGHAPKIETKNKPGVTALREIAAGEVGIEMLRKVPI